VKILFIYPGFERHAQAHPELLQWVPCDEYLGPPSLGIADVAAVTPKDVEVAYVDDRLRDSSAGWPEADLYAMSVFTPAATRAFAIGDELRARGARVVMGGVFPSLMPDEAAAHADAVVIGEGEAVWPEVVADARAGALRPRYQSPIGAPLGELPPPRLDLYLGAENDRFRPDDYPFQTHRGCPLACDACAVPRVTAPKIRFFSEEYLERTADFFVQHGKLASLTEDTSFLFMSGARRRFRQFLRFLREYKGGTFRASYIGISMPLVESLEDEFLTEVRQSGIDRFYLVGGFDPITRAAFGQGDPAAMAKAEGVIRRCHEHDIEPYTSFLVGNDGDDEGVFDRMLAFGDRTKLEKAEFAIATPYPGTPMWTRLVAEERIIDRTWKHYNDANVVFRPARMSPDQLQGGYLRLWREFYAPRQHIAQLEHGRRTIQF
jgi:radical SAM superfamily enzyme YgiQ (UPF0313 family)